MSLGLTQHEPIDSSGVVLAPPVNLHPWRRYVARQIDYLLFGIAVATLAELMGYPLYEGGDRGQRMLIDVALAVGWVPLEAAFLALQGATPGKMLLGINVLTASGGRLTYLEALRRSWWVMAVGIGFGLGLIGAICAWRSKMHLEEEGSAYWDGPEGYVVTHRGFQWRHLGVAAALLLMIGVLLYLNGLFVLPALEWLRGPSSPESDVG